METSTKVLILEHDPNDIELLQYQLRKSGENYITHVVQTRQEYEHALSQFSPDIILSDYSLPSFDGLSAYRIKQELLPDLPFIIVSGTIGEENAVELIKMGVTDYALKEKLYQIPLKVQRALNEAADRKRKYIAEKQLQEREKQLQKIMDLSLDVICTVDEEGRFVTVGAASWYVWGYTPEELIGTRVIDLVHEADKARTYKAIAELKHGVDMVNFENRYIRKDGEPVTMYWSARWDEAEKLGYSIARDATNIKKAEAELQQQNALVNNILESISDGFFAVDNNWKVTYWNKEAERLLHTPREKALGANLWDTFKDALQTKSYEVYHQAMKEQVSITFEDYYPPIDTWFEVTVSPSKDRLVVYFRDITAKKRKQQLIVLEKELFELYTVRNASLQTATTYLLNRIQDLYPEMYCTVLRVNDGRLKNWGAASFPGGLQAALDGVDLEHTSCGTAMALKEKITVTDIETDLLWQENKEPFVRHGLRACTAYPICDTKKNILAVLAVFLTEPREIKPQEEKVTAFIVDILKPLIESDLASAALQKSESKYRNLFDLSPIPMWVFDTETYRFLDVNEAAVQHYGYSRDEFFAMTVQDIRPKEDVELFVEKVNEDTKLARAHRGIHRHIKKNGEVFAVEVSGSAIDLAGRRARVILASDITERIKYIEAIEDQNMRLREIAWVQSHIVRAPLARIMGLVNLLETCPVKQSDTPEILNHISESARELDSIIRDIVNRAEQVQSQPVFK